MANNSIATAYVRLLPDATGIVETLEGDLSKAGRAAGKSAAKSIGDSVAGAGNALAPLSAAAAMVAGGAIKVSTDFDAQMSRVQAISGATGEEFQTLRNLALEMGGSTKFSVTEAAEALEYMGMAGWKTEQMVSGLPGVLSLAAASGEDLGTTSDIVTDALTAFGLTAENSAEFADILAAAATNSNTNVSLMGTTFKYVAPLIGQTFKNAAGGAAQATRDAAIGIGLMANAGIKGGQAGTSFKNIIQRMIKPTKESAEAMQDLGLNITDADGNTKSLRQVMTEMRAAFGDVKLDMTAYNDAVGELNRQLETGEISEEEYQKELDKTSLATLKSADATKGMLAAQLAGAYGLSGLLAIVSSSDEDFEKLAGAIDGASDSMVMIADGSVKPLSQALADGDEVIKEYSGTAEAMAAVMQDNLQGQLTGLSSKLQKLSVSLIDTVLPTLRQFIDWLQKGVDWLNGLDEGTKKMLITAAGVTAIASPILGAVGKLISGVSGLGHVIGGIPGFAKGAAAALTGIKGVATGLFGVIAAHPIVAVITAIIGAITLLWNNCEWFRDAVKGAWKAIKGFFVNAWEGIKAAWSGAGEFFKGIWGKITGAFGNVRDWFKSKFEAARDAIFKVFNADWGQIGRNILEGIGNAITGGASWLWDKAKGLATGFIDAAKGVFGISSPSKVFYGIGDYLMQGLTNGITDNEDAAISAMTGATNQITRQASSASILGSARYGGSSNEQVLELLADYLPKLANRVIQLDTGAVVGGLTQPINQSLGDIRYYQKREVLV